MGNRIKLGMAATCVAVALTIATGGAATAADPTTGDGFYVSAEDTISALQGVSGDLVLDPAEGAGIGTVQLSDAASVNVPADPADGIALDSEGLGVSIGLPGSDAAGSGVVQADGTVTYPGEGFSNSVIASNEGLQLLTTISGSDSPTKYEYDVAIPESAELRETGGGTLAILDQEGNPVAIVLPAWARDANGVAVSTHFALEGDKLVQYVDHRQPGVAYPVVADPKFAWMGVLPTVKLNRSETYNMRYSAMPGKLALCVSLGGVAGVALAVPCAASLAVLSVKAGTIYASGKCMQVLIGPGILGGVEYKDSYCK